VTGFANAPVGIDEKLAGLEKLLAVGALGAVELTGLVGEIFA